MKTCVECNLSFENPKVYANHMRWKHVGNKETFSKNLSKSILAIKAEEKGEMIEVDAICEKCEQTFAFKTYEKKPKHKRFCSIQCSNSRTHSNETKAKIANTLSSSIKKKWENGDYDSVEYKYFSSKAERSILLYLKETYPDDEWTSGGAMKIENEIIVRDMYSTKLKTCIEYDGIWHFKDIHGQLETKKKKDDILNKWCIENGWRIIRISESYWHENGKNFQVIEDALKLSGSLFLGKEFDMHLNE
jgi:hypothetical protein